MSEHKHLVDIYIDRCSGCTRCMRVCPTEALRITNKKVSLKHDHCIYCGNCIMSCHKSAFKVQSDSFASLNKFKVNVAVLPIAMYGMIANERDNQLFYKTMYEFGFDEVFDLSIINHLLSEKIEDFTKKHHDYPYILTQCPSVIRLIRLNYPSLIKNILPFDFPFEIGAKMAKKMYSQKYGVNEEEIGISYITECLSNYSAIKDPIGKEKSEIDHVFLFQDIFKSLVDNLSIEDDVVLEANASNKGVLFSKVGAISNTTNIKEYIAVDGINEVTDILDKIYLNTIPEVKLIEAYSCVGGCIGGNFTLENTYIGKWKVNHYTNSLDNEQSDQYVLSYRNILNENEWYFNKGIDTLQGKSINKSLLESIKRMNQINALLKELPNIDCCACGSPTCRALAEDIIGGVKSINDCVVLRNSEESYES